MDSWLAIRRSRAIMHSPRQSDCQGEDKQVLTPDIILWTIARSEN